MSCSYYIYFRVDPPQAVAARTRCQELLATMAAASGIAGKLLKKKGEPYLWMEVYEDVTDPDRFESMLSDAVKKLDATAFLQPGTKRHIECFEG